MDRFGYRAAPDGEVVRVDCATNRVLSKIAISIGSSEGGIASDDHAVWMPADAGAILVKIDAVRNAVAARIPMPHGSFTAATGLGAVWVSSSDENLVTRIDPSDRSRYGEHFGGPDARFLAVGFGAVWVLNQGDGTVSRIDSSTNPCCGHNCTGGSRRRRHRSRRRCGLGDEPRQTAHAHRSRHESGNDPIRGIGGDGLRVGLGAVWLCSFGLQQVWRIDPSVL
jgi:virginiamycin B lyase